MVMLSGAARYFNSRVVKVGRKNNDESTQKMQRELNGHQCQAQRQREEHTERERYQPEDDNPDIEGTARLIGRNSSRLKLGKWDLSHSA